jgi:fatty-acyl-CoA synthase
MSAPKLVLPGRRADSEWLHRLMVEEGVTIAAAVPTIWLGILKHCRETASGQAGSAHLPAARRHRRP